MLLVLFVGTKTRIFQLEQDEGVIEGEENLNKFITKYYKELFGASQINVFSLDETQVVDIPQVSEAENNLLTDEFTEKEMRDAIFQIKRNKALMVSQRSFTKYFGV